MVARLLQQLWKRYNIVIEISLVSLDIPSVNPARLLLAHAPDTSDMTVGPGQENCTGRGAGCGGVDCPLSASHHTDEAAYSL